MEEKDTPENILNKLKKTPVATLVTMFLSVSTLGLGGYFGTIWYDSVDDAVSKLLKDQDSKTYIRTTEIADSSSNGVSESVVDELLLSSAKYNKIYNSLSGHNGLNDEALTKYVKGMFSFADSIKVMMPTIIENHEWVSHQRDGTSASEYVRCGIILAKEGKPKYFLDCDGTKRKVSYGRPSGVNINAGKKVYYYRNDDDKPILLSYLSNY